MEMSLDTWIAIVSLLVGGGGIGTFFTWKYTRKKEKAEADTAVQDVYQQLIADIKNDRDEQKAYIQELKDDRRHLREERDELRTRQDKLEEDIFNLKREVARNGRMVECMRPFLCGLAPECKKCVPVTISELGEAKPATKTKKDE